jgi:hypothetical protein
MAQPGSPPLRVRVALVAACYACVLLSGALHHVARCADTPRPHCTLCASITTVPLAPGSTLATPELADAVVPEPRPASVHLAAAGGVTRAPPA